MPQTPAEVVHAWFDEVWGHGREEAIDQLMAADAPMHGLSPDGEAGAGPALFKPFFRQMRQAFPDVRIEVVRTIEQGEMVAAHCHVTGTHRGDGLGMPATGRAVDIWGVAIARVQAGQIRESWNSFDFLGMYAQLGLMTPPA